MATTPPLRNSVQIPSTPLHGAKFDICHSSKINKKSTRQSLRQSRRAAQTPSVVNKQYCAESQRLASTYSPPSSANTTPPERTTRKRRRSSLGATIDESMDPSLPRGSGNVDPLVVPDHSKLLGQGPLNLAANMLPTPARTPRKQDKRKASELQSAARILFPGRHEKVEDAMPTAKGRRGRKNIGFSLDSSGEDDGVKDPIQIFTDSKDRYPELDPGHHNPFLEKSDKSESAEPRAPHKVRGRRGRKTKGQVQTNPHIKDAFNHEEGMVYVL